MVAFAISKAHCMTCCVTKFWLRGSLWLLRIRRRHSVSKWVAAAVREERLAEMAECPGSWGESVSQINK